ncbi:hypothetical protein EGW53_08115 [Enterococcus faecium]|nr:hypothetical protein EGW14_08115 [Enterococcus faecium]ROY06733.1 hypothetical protein EGW53_08115 [Enterococcus faecium]ROY60662.1 hypothetical protein EGW62_06680 [Enterococcus faecium]ROZ04110.1 hypothetical protein EGW88_06680 [Enterococcus faecium]ROZ16576.1 hypothetical protein EGW83_08125 [Enterococcus faecium]
MQDLTDLEMFNLSLMYFKSILTRRSFLTGFESIPRTRFVRIFSRFQRVSISSFRPAVKPKPFDR